MKKGYFNESIEKELTDEHQKNVKIANCLNELEKEIKQQAELFCPLELTLSNKYIACDLMKIKIQYLREFMEDDNSIKPFCLKAFECLFIKNEELNYDELDKKINAFEDILGGFTFDMSKIKKQKEYIDSVYQKRKEWAKVIETLRFRHVFMAFIFCVVLTFSQNKKTIVEFLIDCLKPLYNNFIASFSFEELEKIEERKISESLGSLLLGKHANYFKLIIEKNNLVRKLYTVEETEKAINEGECLSEDKIPKEKALSQEQEQDLESEGEEEEEENNYNSGVKSEPINEIMENQTENEEKKQVIKGKEIADIQKSGDSKKAYQKNEIKIKESISNEFKRMIKNLEIKIQNMQNENKEIKKKYKEIQNENKKMKNQIMTMRESNKLKSIKNQNKFEKIETKLSIVESDLNLIKARDALKVFIDFFYRGFNFKEQLSYEERVEKISEILTSSISFKTYDSKLLKMIKKLLKNCIIKLKLGNSYAHCLDLKKSALLQIFNIIDPKRECNIISLRLKDVQADTIITGIIKSRENYYYNKVKLEEEEKVWFEKLTDEKFTSIFK